MLTQLIFLVFDLFTWAWNWELPVGGLGIKPIQLGIAIFVINTLIDTLLPPLDDMVGNDNKED